MQLKQCFDKSIINKMITVMILYHLTPAFLWNRNAGNILVLNTWPTEDLS